jgi:hypothetical protein
MLYAKLLFCNFYAFFLPPLRFTFIALKMPLSYKYLQKLSSHFLSSLRNHYNWLPIDSAIIAETHSMNLLRAT